MNWEWNKESLWRIVRSALCIAIAATVIWHGVKLTFWLTANLK